MLEIELNYKCNIKRKDQEMTFILIKDNNLIFYICNLADTYYILDLHLDANLFVFNASEEVVKAERLNWCFASQETNTACMQNMLYFTSQQDVCHML